jgi:asparagine synthase (glutamine-hydrolysing)
MGNEDQTLVVVFNGEIYNFPQLRQALKARGHVFSSSSDTEVLIHSYEEWGVDCPQRLCGMFAFALYDRKAGTLFLSRDRCGEKPIYYVHDQGGFRFASELQALLTILGSRPGPGPEALYLYLRLGYIPAPYCFFQGVKKLPPGSSLLLRNGTLRQWCYYEPEMTTCRGVDEKELTEELDAVLRRAVRKMLVSDVPLGAFLSGGLDSSLIVAMMAQEGPPPETFSIGFDHASYDESRFAARAARALGSHHTRYPVEFGDFEECLNVMEWFGEPFADSSSIPTYYLARETRKSVTVALSGDGGDEVFGGYRRYLAQKFAGYYRLLPAWLREKALRRMLVLLADQEVYFAESAVKTALVFAERADAAGSASGLMLNTVFSHEEIAALVPDLGDGEEVLQRCLGMVLPDDPVEALMKVDRMLYLPDDILTKVDRMSMRNSLEVRAPFLDPEVLEFAGRVPLRLKIKGLRQKHLLKHLALRYLPEEIVLRRKHGFTVPMAQWLKQAGLEECRRRMPSLLQAEAVNRLLREHFCNGIDHCHKLFALLVLGRYLQ